MITYDRYTTDTPGLKAMLKAASEDPFLGKLVYDRFGENNIYFRDGRTLVGFAMPRLEQGFYRVGPIYVDPAHRGKGIALAFVKDFYASRNGRAYIEAHNTSSIKLFTAAGFRKTGFVYRKDGEAYDQYEKRVNKSLTW